jgi:outer membrane protein OmpA-like peptidoglycan-associated protein
MPVPTVPSATGTANRAIPETPRPSLPANADLYFETGSTKLTHDSFARLNDFASAVAANPNARVTVNGYTDNVGNPAANKRLSQERADAVKGDLVRMGISADRLTTRGLGEENPIADNTTAEGRRMNRRVSVGVEGL